LAYLIPSSNTVLYSNKVQGCFEKKPELIVAGLPIISIFKVRLLLKYLRNIIPVSKFKNKI